jgi:hypothetical protein
MIRIAMLANLAAFSIVLSQPLFYLLALTAAQRALSASAYIELRQRLNPIMSRRVSVIYVTALLTSVALLGLAYLAANGLVLATTALALLGLIADAVYMVRENVPINQVMDGWSLSDYPADWHTYRDRWLGLLAYRQVFLTLAFGSLLVGAVFDG